MICKSFYKKICSTAALDCRTGQNKGRYREKELLFLLISLVHCINEKQKTVLNEEKICNSVMSPTKSDYEYWTRLVRTLFLMSRHRSTSSYKPLSFHSLWLYLLCNNFILRKYLEGIIPDSFLQVPTIVIFTKYYKH